MSFKLMWALLLAGLICYASVNAETDEDIDVDVDDEEPVEDAEKPKEKPVYVQPVASGNVFLTETFESPDDLKKSWILSQAKKDDIDEDIAKYDGQWKVEEASDSPLQGDLGLVLKSRAKHHAISAKLNKPFDFSGKPFVVQYEVKFQNGQECGGAYIKLLSKGDKLDLKKFYDKTPYTIMFGPDKCGNDNKLHFIFRHKNPVTGKFEEKHANKPSASLDAYFTDKKTHLYTLVVNPDNTFEVLVDQEVINSGSLLEDVNPPVNPPEEIVDPEDKKPEDWDEREKIPDPDAEKPEDWDENEPEMMTDPDAVKPDGWLDDEPELIPDPDSEMPEDWEEDIDGEWEPAMIQNPACEEAPGCGEWVPAQIKNPKYKGKWRAPLIDNPNYKGKWMPRKIPNPDFFEDKEPYKMTPIAAVGLELWSMSDDILFDNFIITDDKSVAGQWAADSWSIKRKQELAGGSSGDILSYLWNAANERKWLFGVYVAVALLPLVLLSIWCCPNSGPLKTSDFAAEAKKTDAPTPDDDYKQDDESEDDVKEDEAKKKADSKKDASAKKGAGDAPAKAKAKKSDLDAEEEEEVNEADNEEDDGASKETRSSPRKRKTRSRKD